MNRFAWLGVGLLALGLSVAKAENGPENPARERVELAKRIYRERILMGLNQRIVPAERRTEAVEDPLLNESMAEVLHKWSVRWMEAEHDAATDQAGRVSAAQAHLERMKTLELGKMVRQDLADEPLVKELIEKKSFVVDIDVEALKEVGELMSVANRRYQDVARYFRLEAEALLAKEKAAP